MRKPLAALVAVLGALALSGCGDSGGSAPDSLPSDFKIAYAFNSASVAPPDHYAYDVKVGANGKGSVSYFPGFSEGGVESYHAPIAAPKARMDELWAAIRDDDVLGKAGSESDDAPIGGDSSTATIHADGKTYKIPAFSGTEATLTSVDGPIRDLVPDRVWRSFEARRDAAAKKKYGRVPTN